MGNSTDWHESNDYGNALNYFKLCHIIPERREKQLPVSKKMRSVFLVSCTHLSHSEIWMFHPSTWSICHQEWDVRCQQHARELGSVGQHCTGARCVTSLHLREESAWAPLAISSFIFVSWYKNICSGKGELAAAQFMLNRGVVMNDNIPCIHSVPLVWVSNYLRANLNTGKVLKESLSSSERPGGDSALRTCEPFPIQNGLNIL